LAPTLASRDVFPSLATLDLNSRAIHAEYYVALPLILACHYAARR
jgi:hypothetical protein